jgi:hypothetical protein
MLKRRTFQLEGEPQGNGNGAAPDFAGYPDLDKLREGYHQSSQEAKRWRERAQALEQHITQAPRERQAVPDRSSPADRLQEWGVPVDALREMMQQEFRTALEPVGRTIQARSNVLATYGDDYNKFEADALKHVQSDPHLTELYQRVFNADPEAAMRWAYLEYGASRKPEREAEPKARRNSEAAHAAVPTSRASESRIPREANDDAKEAFKAFRDTGDPRAAAAFARIRLGKVISDDFLNR